MTAPSVLHLLPSQGWGGAEQLAATLRRLAEDHGWSASLDVLRAAHGGTEGWFAWARRARSATVVHAHLPWPDRLGPVLLAARGLPLVATFHLLPDPAGWPRDRLAALPSDGMLRLAGRLRRRVRWVALSRADARRLEALLGVRVHQVRNAPPAPGAPREALAWPEGAVRLLSVGRLDEQKGFDRMLDALAHPSLRGFPWHWTVLGDGAERDALARAVAARDLGERVTLAGARPAAEGYATADFVLAPSRREGMPLVPLEAIEAGVPVLASAIDPHRELFESVQDSLLPDGEGEWPAALARWLGAPGRRRALALAQRAVLGNNPRDAMWTAYEALYRSVAAPTPEP